MPQSQLEPIPARPEDSKLRLQQIGVAPHDREAFRAAALTAAQEAVSAYPRLLETVRTALTEADLPSALAAFSAYGMQAGVTSGGEVRPALPDILQHHCELLHAIALTLPRQSWSSDPIQPKIMQTLFEATPKLSDTFYLQRILDRPEDEADDEKLVVRSLQEKIRMHTHGVRNWGYFQHVAALSRDLYAALDDALVARLGFGASAVIDALSAIVAEYEKRQAAHWEILRRVSRGKTARDVVKLYYRFAPGLVGTAEDLLKALPGQATRQQMFGMVMAHCDLRLVDLATFSAADVAGLAGIAENVAGALLNALSLTPDALKDVQPHMLFLDNPVWDKPAIALGQIDEPGRSFLFPTPASAFSHIHRLMDRLVREAGLEAALKDRRAAFLESELEALFRSALPSAAVRSGVTWRRNGQQFETDLIAVIDHVVVIVEAKSHRLTPQGLRGAPDRIRRHIREMVVDPSVQSARLETLILDAREGDEAALEAARSIGVDPARADRIIRLSVTLDDFSVLSSSEKDFRRLGWIPADHHLAPTILIADLRCIAEILGNELQILHYLSERIHLQKDHDLLGDELDFLGLYLTTGFSLPEFDEGITGLAATGMSQPIDAYYQSHAAPSRPKKPTLELRPYFRSVLDQIVSAKPPGWTLIGLHLLSSAAPGEQRALERNLAKLRASVRRNHRDPGHACTLFLAPRLSRKAALAFYLFPEERRSGIQDAIEQIFADNVDTLDRNALLVFARGTERWGRPFEVVQLFERAESTGASLNRSRLGGGATPEVSRSTREPPGDGK